MRDLIVNLGCCTCAIRLKPFTKQLVLMLGEPFNGNCFMAEISSGQVLFIPTWNAQ